MISGNVGTLTVNGGARTTWEASNTFVGNVDIQGAGTILQVGGGGNNQIPDSSNVNVGAGARLHLVFDDEAINGLSGNGTVAFFPGGGLGATTLIVGAGNGGGNFSGLIENGSPTTMNLVKIGTGHAGTQRQQYLHRRDDRERRRAEGFGQRRLGRGWHGDDGH